MTHHNSANLEGSEPEADEREGFPRFRFGTDTMPQRWSGLGGPMLWRRSFPGRGDQAAPARKMVRCLLEDTPRAEDAEWVTAELTSNAIIHTRSGLPGGFFTVEVTRGLHMAQITVYDLGGGSTPTLGVRRPGEVIGEHGHGLRGVRRLAVQAGVTGDAVTGHAVWAQLMLNAPDTMRSA